MSEIKRRRPHCICVVWLLVFLAAGAAVPALDITGVQIAAMDQPRVMVMFRRTPNGAPLAAKGNAVLADLLGPDSGAGDAVSRFAAYLDTGASGIVISRTTADSLGILRLQTVASQGAKPIVFHDVGVGGADKFAVSEPLYLTWGPYETLGETAADGVFAGTGAPANCQIGPLEGGGMLEGLMGTMDVMGMPAMVGKIIVIDPRAVSKLEDVMRVQILDGRTGKAPATSRHVLLSSADFSSFTRIEPADAAKPALAANPFIGTGPVGKAPRQVPAIVVSHGGKRSAGAWLLDTGAVASMMSLPQAAALGIRYKIGTQNTDAPVLEGVAADKQFTLSLGGIGGTKKAAGFYVDELRLSTREGDPLVYRAAPVLVNDITVEHPVTKQKVTLDGVFGMNLLVASAQITEGVVPDLGNMSAGPYDLIVIDLQAGVLGLQLRQGVSR